MSARTPLTAAGALAGLAAALVDDPDAADVLAHLVRDCAELMGADAVALMGRESSGDLSLLAATSHRATELEMLQIQHSTGPCVDAIASNEAVSASGATAMEGRWGRVGLEILTAGFVGVESYPMRWRGLALGALNVFRTTSSTVTPEAATLGQAFADMATLVLVQAVPVSTDQFATRLHDAIGARELVEQAKGVLAYREGLTMATAYDQLMHRAATGGVTLTEAAYAVVHDGSPEARRSGGGPDPGI